jgi:mannose-6-phosphate isomerase-like protein (cupin superfamily)
MFCETGFSKKETQVIKVGKATREEREVERMAEIRHVKRAAIEAMMKETQPGFYQAEMLPGAMEGVETYKCRLLKGAGCKLESYKKKGVSLFFIGGNGQVFQGDVSFEITERAVFCPDINGVDYRIQAESDMEFLLLIQAMSQEDLKHYEMYHIVLPWFNTAKQWHLYTEGFRNEDLKSFACLHQYYVSRMSLGEVVGPGNAKLEPHKHPELFQWFYGLPGTDPFLFHAGDETVDVEEGDWICIPNETYHIVSPKKDKDYVDYVWFEVVVPGLEMCPYFY